jgi:hypothetical protein
MSRRVVDLIAYLVVIFPLNLLEFYFNIGWGLPIYYFAGFLFVPAMIVIFVIILFGRLQLAILVQALYGISVIVLKSIETFEIHTGENLFMVMFSMVLILLLIPVSLMYSYQKRVVERRSPN